MEEQTTINTDEGEQISITQYREAAEHLRSEAAAYQRTAHAFAVAGNTVAAEGYERMSAERTEAAEACDARASQLVASLLAASVTQLEEEQARLSVEVAAHFEEYNQVKGVMQVVKTEFGGGTSPLHERQARFLRTAITQKNRRLQTIKQELARLRPGPEPQPS